MFELQLIEIIKINLIPNIFKNYYFPEAKN